jgi:hypothetical protein
MAAPIKSGNRPNNPNVGDWLAKGFISQEQHDAYTSNDPEKLKRADKEAEERATDESIKNLTPNSTRRTNATVSNRVGNHSNSSNSGANPRNAKAVSHNNQKTRATATPRNRVSLTFDSIKTTMEQRGFVRIKPFEVTNKEGESAILTFLKTVQKNTSSTHSSAWSKYHDALSKASKFKKDNDEPELCDFQGNNEYEEMVTILTSLKKNNSNLGDLSIVLQWVGDDGNLRTDRLGTGNQEVHLVITPDENFEAFFKTSK